MIGARCENACEKSPADVGRGGAYSSASIPTSLRMVVERIGSSGRTRTYPPSLRIRLLLPDAKATARPRRSSPSSCIHAEGSDGGQPEGRVRVGASSPPSSWRPERNEKVALQVGLEPTTLRLTGGKRVLSRRLLPVAHLPNRAVRAENIDPCGPSLCAALCRPCPRFVGRKGQEKGNRPPSLVPFPRRWNPRPAACGEQLPVPGVRRDLREAAFSRRSLVGPDTWRHKL